jgi:hypothetical protein
MSEWTETSMCKPPAYVYVTALFEHCIVTAMMLLNGSWQESLSGQIIHAQPKYWCEIPQPPSE